MSATLLGEPDVGLLTPPEMARKCNQIAASNPGLSIIADADTGGGNSLNVQRTVRQLISNGVKGCVLEDQVWPKKSGHIREKSVETMEEFAAKVSAARAVIGDSDFFLIARTVCRSPAMAPIRCPSIKLPCYLIDPTCPRLSHEPRCATTGRLAACGFKHARQGVAQHAEHYCALRTL